jgi:hypothetical protein
MVKVEWSRSNVQGQKVIREGQGHEVKVNVKVTCLESDSSSEGMSTGSGRNWPFCRFNSQKRTSALCYNSFRHSVLVLAVDIA